METKNKFIDEMMERALGKTKIYEDKLQSHLNNIALTKMKLAEAKIDGTPPEILVDYEKIVRYHADAISDYLIVTD